MDDATYDWEGEEESAAKPRRPGFPVEPRRILRILAENRLALIRAFMIASAVALFASLFVPRTYESSAQLLYEGTPILERHNQSPAPAAFIRSATAPSRLRETRERLGWDISLEELESRVGATPESPGTVSINGRGGTAEEAQALAQTLLDVFLARQASFNAKQLERLTAENRLALERAKQRLQDATEAYESFREKSGKPHLIQEQEQLLQRGAELRSRADEAAVEVAAQRARITELEKAQRELPRQIMASARRGSPIDAPLNEARAELAAARASLSEHHPKVQALKQRVASLQAQRKGATIELAEQSMVSNPARAAVDEELATSRAALAAAKERESALRVLLKANEEQAASLAPEEDEARRVIGELDLARARVEELTDRVAVLRDARLSELTGFRVLSAPMLPEEAHLEVIHVVLLVMLPILTVLIFALAVIVRQLRGLTVEAPCEVAWWGNGPVVGMSIWPRDPDALESFVDELEDYGVYGAGRTLVVPATEAERSIACSFAMRLAEAPWLAAAILDVGERAGGRSHDSTLVTPPPRPKRLSSQSFVAPTAGSIPSSPIMTPPPSRDAKRPLSSTPPRKKTMIGLPAVRSSPATRISTEPPPAVTVSASTPSVPPKRSSSPEPFRRKRGARATVRMIMPVTGSAAPAWASAARDSGAEEEAFLLTRPVPFATDQTPSRIGRAVHESTKSPHAGASNAVMRAAVKLLGNDEDDTDSLRRSEPPAALAPGGVTGVALAWNGPLTGPVLRRAARLAHRVMVVVSSGMSAIDLARVQTRLGRDKGVGYVLVNLRDAYVHLHDRIGPVEDFWEGLRDRDGNDPRVP